MSDDSLSADLVTETGLRQRRASTPSLSAWVSANAGSGKTHVLSQRVIRLLLGGARPSAILCLTYTKAAAAEMSNRVFRMLAEWSRLDDPALSGRIARIQGTEPSAADLTRARQLFATALETPGGLKIQTIHAFCEAVLQRFPLEANVAGRFNVLDDQAAANLLAESRRMLFSTSHFETDPQLPGAVMTALDLGGEHGFDQLLGGLYSRRREIAAFRRKAEAQGGVEPCLRRALGVAEGESRADVEARIWPLPGLPDAILRDIEAVATAAKLKTASAFATGLLAAGQSDPQERLAQVREIFFTQAGKPRSLSTVAGKAVAATLPDIEDRLAQALAHVVATEDALRAHAALESSLAAMIIARRYLGEFDELKHRQAYLDYDDLIDRTESLLARSGAGAWVHYKLDQGIDHILVDEAQDTAPLQWSVIRSLSAEFFAGSGARPGLRTLFSVGDEKQSIYSFQGARPEQFAEERSLTERRARAARMQFERISLRVSFRSAREILTLVDLVFASDDASQGLGEDRAAVIHETARLSAPGRAELWEMLASDASEESESWTEPFDHTPETAPAARLASRIATVLQAWIGHDRIMDARTGLLRPVSPGDVLVLVRKRDGFVPTLLRTLKATSDIPVAGADRLRLTDHVAVQDLMALGRHALLADDDLSLAALVKSPLVGLSEDQLFRLAAGRPDGMSLSDHLDLLSADDADFARMSARLSHWCGLARRLSVHDFYATVIGPGGGRELFLARLGREVGDVLDEFLGLTLDHEEAGIPGLQSFLAMLETESPEIKREMEQGTDAVRVMTVHAAKGLEAPFVFLVDSGGEAFQPSHLPRVWLLPERPGETGPGSVPVWFPTKDHRTGASDATHAVLKLQAEEEYRRLLYVGLTRAADRLVVCGYRGLREAKSPTWHSLVTAGFDRAAADGASGRSVSDITHGEGDSAFSVRCLLHDRAPPARPADVMPAPPPAAAPPFECPSSPLPPDRELPRPLVPSGVGAVIDDAEEGPPSSPFQGPAALPTPALDRGRAMHRLLQVLPGMAAGERPAAAQRYVSRALPGLPDADRQAMVGRVLAILSDPAFAAAFEGTAAAEVSVMGTLSLRGAERTVTGRIDRLAVDGDRVLIIDYKTGQPPAPDAVPAGHVAQLAIYRALLKPLYPAHAITAALLYTAGPLLIRLGADELDLAFARLGGA
ncbi:DNA helicase/exodeoxyribonuclease V subunit A [Hoeflea marina]|uniref:DNA 3'-5' helicase n=1 Tax=Hoeflea marina TaxID=274592 RepID=A0A317PPZ8_9HYPH|nr:double-strand break repair helicase AddA [Hoeflea marina]PWW00511.1 DNA helicase/exodeoxyribonuclease V subunit A [Hoeflea marina]